MDTLNRLNECFANDAEIDEFGFVMPPHDALDEHGVLHVDHKLGLSYAVLAPLAAAAADVMREAQLESTSAVGKEADAARARVLTASRAAVFVNGENRQALAARRRAWNSGGESACERELQWTALAQSKHAKAEELWLHRRLVLKMSNSLPLSSVALDCEREACDAALKRYPRCYNAWVHRAWMLSNADACKNVASERALFVGELLRSALWLRRNVSDYSAYAHRQRLIARLVELAPSPDAVKLILCTERSFVAHMIKYYPGHESAWYYARFLVALWREKDFDVPLCKVSENRSKREENLADADNEDVELDTGDEIDDCALGAKYDAICADIDKSSLESSVNRLAKLCCSLRSVDLCSLPSVESELHFALFHINDSAVERFEAQREAAAAFAVWILYLHFGQTPTSAERGELLRKARYDSKAIEVVESSKLLKNKS